MSNKRNILIIDDSSSSLVLMELLVVKEGHTALLAESVKKAITYIKQQKPDLILLDLSLPVISGYDFLNMRGELEIQEVPIIVISAFDAQENIDKTIKLGAAEFLSKPLMPNIFKEIIKKYLN